MTESDPEDGESFEILIDDDSVDRTKKQEPASDSEPFFRSELIAYHDFHSPQRDALITRLYDACSDLIGHDDPTFPWDGLCMRQQSTIDTMIAQFSDELQQDGQYARFYLTPGDKEWEYNVKREEHVWQATPLLFARHLRDDPLHDDKFYRKFVAVLAAYCAKYAQGRFKDSKAAIPYVKQELERIKVTGVPMRFVIYRYPAAAEGRCTYDVLFDKPVSKVTQQD